MDRLKLEIMTFIHIEQLVCPPSRLKLENEIFPHLFIIHERALENLAQDQLETKDMRIQIL